MIRSFKLCILVLSFFTANAVQADVGDWYVAPSVTYFDDDPDRKIDAGFSGGQIQVGKQMSERFSLEGLLGYHDIDGFPGQEHLELGVNAIGNFMPDAMFSPYALGGLSYLRADVGTPDFGGLPEADSTASDIAASAGLGLMARFGDSPWAARLEWRLRHAFGDSLTDHVAAVGLQYTFGSDSDGAVAATSTAAPVAVMDSDGDSVIDSLDNCPNTPRGVAVDLNGCPVDADGDGVRNDRDRCPGTDAGAMVDLNGCEFPTNVSLAPVFFATGSARLDSEARQALDEAVELLLRHPGLPVEIEGHADSQGSEDFNMALSLVRAEVVRLHLEQAGVRASSLSVQGFGESQPAASNDTAAGRAQNRRVVLEMRDR
jgi:OOP family OmpA-OmpF porin